jgi:hypothetical protein
MAYHGPQHRRYGKGVCVSNNMAKMQISSCGAKMVRTCPLARASAGFAAEPGTDGPEFVVQNFYDHPLR